MASPYMGKYLRISSYIRRPFLIYDFTTAPLRISLYTYKENLILFFISATVALYHVQVSGRPHPARVISPNISFTKVSVKKFNLL